MRSSPLREDAVDIENTISINCTFVLDAVTSLRVVSAGSDSTHPDSISLLGQNAHRHLFDVGKR
jgi:hypothetical protein